MTTITLEQTQTPLTEFIHRLMPGEEVVITENDQIIARLVMNPLPSTEQAEPQNQWPCKAGSAKGKIRMAADFDEPLEEFKEYMGERYAPRGHHRLSCATARQAGR